MREQTFQRINGVGDLKLRILLESKEKRQIQFDAVVGGI